MIYLVSLVFIVVATLELPYLIKNKMWRETAAYSGLLIIGMIYSFGFVLDLDIPGLSRLMKIVFMPVTRYIEQLLS